QTQQILQARYPHLHIYKNQSDLHYHLTSLYTFKHPLSPHLPFKIQTHHQFNHQTIIHKLQSLQPQFDIILIQPPARIPLPIYQYTHHFYITTHLIKHTSHFILTLLPSKLPPINHPILHHKYIHHHQLPPNLLIINNYTHTPIQHHNLHTIQKLTHNSLYTLPHQSTQQTFSQPFIQPIIAPSNP
uniref:dethiobiotin synthase n=1 Tax=Staphylococcus epidermidis TaxID=1282 RepID=UPI0028CBAE41